MATNVELVAAIAALDESAATDGLNNAQLSALLKSLKADEEAAPHTPRIAPGKSITSKRGILGPGEQVHEGDVNDIADLKKRGFII